MIFDCLVVLWPIPEEEEEEVVQDTVEERVARASSWSNATTADGVNVLLYLTCFYFKNEFYYFKTHNY